jgi:putative (di)nucleoside polyphosphate hydrolase
MASWDPYGVRKLQTLGKWGWRYREVVSSQYFRAGVVIVVRHPNGREVLAFERVDIRGSWQLPQGGMHRGEEPLAAAWRELKEETGLGEGDVIVASEHPEWIAYEWPGPVIEVHGREGRRRGQVQKWFFFDVAGDEITPTPDGSEFVDWRWVEPQWLIDHVIEFRRNAYQRVLGDL